MSRNGTKCKIVSWVLSTRALDVIKRYFACEETVWLLWLGKTRRETKIELKRRPSANSITQKQLNREPFVTANIHNV